MLAFAECEFALSELQGDGATLRHHLRMVAQQTGKNPKELDELTSTRCPDALLHVWSMFLELNRSRCGNGFGANPISYTEMQAWSQLTEQQPTPLDVAAIKSIDAIYLNYQAKAAKKAAATPPT